MRVFRFMLRKSSNFANSLQVTIKKNSNEEEKRTTIVRRPGNGCTSQCTVDQL